MCAPVRLSVVLLVLVLASSRAGAEGAPLMLADADARRIADYASTALVGAQIAGDIIHAWHTSDRWLSVRCELLQIGAAVTAAETTKRLVHRTRPNGINARSFYSEHATLAAAAAGWRYSVSVPIVVGVGLGRQLSGWHYATDVVAGLGVGFLTWTFC
jgi:membrane-associated phospholipid phosphatase